MLNYDECKISQTFGINLCLLRSHTTDMAAVDQCTLSTEHLTLNWVMTKARKEQEVTVKMYELRFNFLSFDSLDVPIRKSWVRHHFPRRHFNLFKCKKTLRGERDFRENLAFLAKHDLFPDPNQMSTLNWNVELINISIWYIDNIDMISLKCTYSM